MYEYLLKQHAISNEFNPMNKKSQEGKSKHRTRPTWSNLSCFLHATLDVLFLYPGAWKPLRWSVGAA